MKARLRRREGDHRGGSDGAYQPDISDDEEVDVDVPTAGELARLDLGAATTPSVPPEIRQVLNLGDVPALERRGGEPRKRWTGHRRFGVGEAEGGAEDGSGREGCRTRAAPGPPPPKSWVSGGDQGRGWKGSGNGVGRGKGASSAGRGSNGRRQGQERFNSGMSMGSKSSVRHRCYFGLDLALAERARQHHRHHHGSERLSCMVARKMAHHWDEMLEMEQYNLATLPVRMKALLLGNIGMYGPDVVTIRTLQVLFLNRAELDGATGAEELKELDLSMLVGGGGRWKGLTLKGLLHKMIISGRIHEEDELFPVLLTSPVPSSLLSFKDNNESLGNPQQHDPLPESWDDEDDESNIINNNSYIPKSLTSIRFTDLTNLSLARPQFSYPSNPWSDLLALTKHLPTLTYLSLAYWPTPTLTPNSRTAYVSPSSRIAGAPPSTGPLSTAIPLSGTHFYSSMDDDWSEAAGILRRLSANTYCLQSLDLEGCAEWWPALVWPLDKQDGDDGHDVENTAQPGASERSTNEEDEWGDYGSRGASSSARSARLAHSARRQNPHNNHQESNPNKKITREIKVCRAGIDWTGPWRDVLHLNLLHCADAISDSNSDSSPAATSSPNANTNANTNTYTNASSDPASRYIPESGIIRNYASTLDEWYSCTRFFSSPSMKHKREQLKSMGRAFVVILQISRWRRIAGLEDLRTVLYDFCACETR